MTRTTTTTCTVRGYDGLPAELACPDIEHYHLLEGRDAGGPRHFLQGKPVNAGRALELLVYDERIMLVLGGDPKVPFPRVYEPRWIRGRYEWSFDPSTPGRGYSAPTFHVDLGANAPGRSSDVDDAPSHYEATLDLPPYARLRWPPREATR